LKNEDTLVEKQEKSSKKNLKDILKKNMNTGDELDLQKQRESELEIKKTAEFFSKRKKE